MPPTETDEDLQQQLSSLRSVVAMLLIAVLCVGLGAALFLYRQVALINGQVVEARRLVLDHETNALPRITRFVDSLQGYAKSNPDFMPILIKYGATNSMKAAVQPAAKK
jgi:hypothetical protein